MGHFIIRSFKKSDYAQDILQEQMCQTLIRNLNNDIRALKNDWEFQKSNVMGGVLDHWSYHNYRKWQKRVCYNYLLC